MKRATAEIEFELYNGVELPAIDRRFGVIELIIDQSSPYFNAFAAHSYGSPLPLARLHANGYLQNHITNILSDLDPNDEWIIPKYRFDELTLCYTETYIRLPKRKAVFPRNRDEGYGFILTLPINYKNGTPIIGDKMVIACAKCRTGYSQVEVDHAYLMIPLNKQTWDDWRCPECLEN